MDFNDITLYHYWRSSASYRVRIALEYKHLKPKMVAVNLLDGSSESPEHLARHPLGYVPVLQVHGKNIIESVAIIEWLDEIQPAPALFPVDSYEKAHVRALVEVVNSGTQPLQNIPVVEHHSSDPDEQKKWMCHFALRGLEAYDKLSAKTRGTYSIGGKFSAADAFLVPQCYAAIRFGVDLKKDLPRLNEIYENCLKLPFVEKAHPDLYKPTT